MGINAPLPPPPVVKSVSPKKSPMWQNHSESSICVNSNNLTPIKNMSTRKVVTYIPKFEFEFLLATQPIELQP